jgi:hypothetical protein
MPMLKKIADHHKTYLLKIFLVAKWLINLWKP